MLDFALVWTIISSLNYLTRRGRVQAVLGRDRYGDGFWGMMCEEEWWKSGGRVSNEWCKIVLWGVLR